MTDAMPAGGDAFQLRCATAEDLPAIVELHMAVQALHHDAEPDRYKPADRGSIEALVQLRLGTPEHEYLVATASDGTVAGYVLCVRKQSADTPLTRSIPFVELEEISVRQTVRRRGVARALCDEAARRARARGAASLRITVRHVNGPAQAAYAALGYQAAQHQLEMKL